MAQYLYTYALEKVAQLRKKLCWMTLPCTSTTFSAQLTACRCDMGRHLKTEPTKTVEFCFGYPSQLIIYCVNWLDEVGTKVFKVNGT
jgi:hypothetical protein